MLWQSSGALTQRCRRSSCSVVTYLNNDRRCRRIENINNSGGAKALLGWDCASGQRTAARAAWRHHATRFAYEHSWVCRSGAYRSGCVLCARNALQRILFLSHEWSGGDGVGCVSAFRLLSYSFVAKIALHTVLLIEDPSCTGLCLTEGCSATLSRKGRYLEAYVALFFFQGIKYYEKLTLEGVKVNPTDFCKLGHLHLLVEDYHKGQKTESCCEVYKNGCYSICFLLIWGS